MTCQNKYRFRPSTPLISGVADARARLHHDHRVRRTTRKPGGRRGWRWRRHRPAGRTQGPRRGHHHVSGWSQHPPGWPPASRRGHRLACVPFYFSGRAHSWTTPFRMFVRDIEARHRPTGVKARISSAPTGQKSAPGVEAGVAAVAQAHKRAGAPIATTHAGRRRGLRKPANPSSPGGGPEPSEFIGHYGDARLPGKTHRRRLHLGMDRFGVGVISLRFGDPGESRGPRYCNGHADKMVLSHDACCPDALPRAGAGGVPGGITSTSATTSSRTEAARRHHELCTPCSSTARAHLRAAGAAQPRRAGAMGLALCVYRLILICSIAWRISSSTSRL